MNLADDAVLVASESRVREGLAIENRAEIRRCVEGRDQVTVARKELIFVAKILIHFYVERGTVVSEIAGSDKVVDDACIGDVRLRKQCQDFRCRRIDLASWDRVVGKRLMRQRIVNGRLAAFGENSLALQRRRNGDDPAASFAPPQQFRIEEKECLVA